MSKDLAFILFGTGICVFAGILTFLVVREAKAMTKSRRKREPVTDGK